VGHFPPSPPDLGPSTSPWSKKQQMASLANKRILVTGGGGFIGSHIIDLLERECCRSIVAIDNFTRGRPENLANALKRQNVSLINGDIRDRDLLRSQVGAADVVFHQAALRITHCAAEPRAALETMVDATFELAETCAKVGVEKVIFASSASIYGMAEVFPTPERHYSQNDRTLYGVAKLFGEGVLRAFADMCGLRYVVLRYFNVYGPRMDIHGRYTEVLIRWMERIEAGVPPVIFGDGAQTMDFIDVRDVARANVLAAKSDIVNEVFNVASGRETSLLDLVKELTIVMGRPQLAPEFRAARRTNPVVRRLADTTKARRALGFVAGIPLRTGLSDLIAWWRQERQRGLVLSEHRVAT
jgi:UDP-glucose 4-epimerase